MEGVVWEILLLGLLPQWKEGEEGENRNRLLKKFWLKKKQAEQEHLGMLVLFDICNKFCRVMGELHGLD